VWVKQIPFGNDKQKSKNNDKKSNGKGKKLQGNRISKQLQESDKKGIVPSGAFEFSA
jgi:hypothetical protein